MPKVHSHYDNLKVARDASAPDIRAAYRALTRKHHPDRHPGNADAQRVMSMINVAYGVLCDPAKRSEHDRWIARSEADIQPQPLRHPRPSRPPRAGPTLHAPSERYRQQTDAPGQAGKRHAAPGRRTRGALLHMLRHRTVYAFAGFGALCALIVVGTRSPGSAFDKPMPRPWAAEAAPASVPVAGYARSPAAPNGQSWPARSGYVDGYPLTNTGGLSEVKVDNIGGDADLFVKLVSLDGLAAFPARTFFVAANSHLTLDRLTPGTYELRFRNLVSGRLWRSPALILEEVPTPRGPQPSSVAVSLYATSDGRMKAYALLDTEF